MLSTVEALLICITRDRSAASKNQTFASSSRRLSDSTSMTKRLRKGDVRMECSQYTVFLFPSTNPCHSFLENKLASAFSCSLVGCQRTGFLGPMGPHRHPETDTLDSSRALANAAGLHLRVILLLGYRAFSISECTYREEARRLIAVLASGLLVLLLE